MKYFLPAAFILLTAFFGSLPAHSEAINISLEQENAIGASVQFFKEQKEVLNVKSALKLQEMGEFSQSDTAFLNFNISTTPVWLAFEILNPSSTSVQRRLSVETSWLDELDVYFITDGEIATRYQVGDARPHRQRPISHRFFVFDQKFRPGFTKVLMRVETSDPMVLPIFLKTLQKEREKETFQGYSYGLLYGFLVALLAYNLMLYFGLRGIRYLYYAIYLAGFIVANMAYTGHGFWWLWPDSPEWQRWSNPILMMFYAISGLLFAIRFLEIKINFPRVYRYVIGGCLLFGGTMAAAIATDNQALALLIAFFFMLVFSFAMVFLGIISVRAGNRSARYFLLASITATLGSVTTTLVVWGLIPYSILAYRAVDIGMMVDATLLALALADRFRIGQEERLQAEDMARLDPLTELNNRRAFYELTRPLWESGLRQNRDVAIILTDLDWFKSVNDTFGHAQGDKVLTHIAKILSEEARLGDIVARWGGEEFILFLPDAQLDEAVLMAERLRNKIANEFMNIGGDRVSFTASFGVAKNQYEEHSLDDLISKADEQLYRAKESGRNRVCSKQISQTAEDVSTLGIVPPVS